MVKEFTRLDAAPVLPARPQIVGPTPAPDSVLAFVSSTTPGGPGVVQTLIVLLVYAAYIFRAPATPWSLIIGALVLMLTPWVPVLFGYGSTIAASIIFLNVLAGAFSYKVFMARTES